jgi:hypothetical protein
MTRGRNEPVGTRLFSRMIVQDNGCWEWQGARNNAGYGFIRDGSRMKLTHRVSYEQHHNTSIPKGVEIGHTCYNYCCVNPEHLYSATRQQIVDKMVDNDRHNRQPKRTGPHKRITCPHCGKEGPVTTHYRYHMDNCKLKP